MEDKYYFDKLYKESEDLLWKSAASEKYLDILLSRLTKGKILDLGAGEGGGAIYLAKKGFEVTAVDISEAALKKLSYLKNKIR